MENNQLFNNIVYVFAIDICFFEYYLKFVLGQVQIDLSSYHLFFQENFEYLILDTSYFFSQKVCGRIWVGYYSLLGFIFFKNLLAGFLFLVIILLGASLYL